MPATNSALRSTYRPVTPRKVGMRATALWTMLGLVTTTRPPARVMTARMKKATGMSTFHENPRSWSMRNRGYVHRTHMKTKMTAYSLMTNHRTGGSEGPGQGLCHPPRKRVTAMAAMANISPYSPSWNRANRIPVYSEKYPATSSLSASTRSKGTRLTSAVAAVRKMRKATGWTTTYHRWAWAFTMVTVDSDPASIATVTRARPMGIS